MVVRNELYDFHLLEMVVVVVVILSMVLVIRLFAFYIVVFANMHAKIQNSRGLPASLT